MDTESVEQLGWTDIAVTHGYETVVSHICVHIEWKDAPLSIGLNADYGTLTNVAIVHGEGVVFEGGVRPSGGPLRLALLLDNANLGIGPYPSRISVVAENCGFTFLLRDVRATTPIWIPEYGVVVTTEDDTREYAAIEAHILGCALQTESQVIDSATEETYERACDATRNQVSPIWLGLSRDMRLFSLNYNEKYGYWGTVTPRYHSTGQFYKAIASHPVSISFVVGRGAACSIEITKRLDEGYLPIVHSLQHDGPVRYEMTAFITLENHLLCSNAVKGTDCDLVYANTGGRMLTPDAESQFVSELQRYKDQSSEETVCCIRFKAVNTDAVPRYAWFKACYVDHFKPSDAEFHDETGYTKLSDGRVVAINRLGGQAMPSSEMAVLIQPGESIDFQLLIPHLAVSCDRAQALATLNFDEHLNAAKAFWMNKLSSGAQISVPEPAIDERIKAGLLHLDIAACGAEPDGNVAATIGWYSPIGSESAPIIQFFDSMGWHELARRCIQFFLDRQRPDGFIQNFSGYQLETGAVLWTIGEHYRYTRADEWACSVMPNVLKASEYLIAWRERNKRAELRGNGYGLQDGKVADPDDFFHSFMLNALSYIGLARSSEMLGTINSMASTRLSAEASAFREDIRIAYSESVARSPVVPLGDGSWCPSSAPWTEYPGPVALYADGGKWFTHGSFASRDSLIGSTYLALSEVFDVKEPMMEFLLKTHQQLFTHRNAAFSQPYYSRHDFMHIRRGQVKEFLKTYYNQLASLQDRETYNFWEHYFGVSEHKTHEEGWFLMQTRWMLYFEAGDTLRLLPAIPRRWLVNDQQIEIKKVSSYFGSFDLHIVSHIETGSIEADVRFHSDRAPQQVAIRLPHPNGCVATSVDVGSYDPLTETVWVNVTSQVVSIQLKFEPSL